MQQKQKPLIFITNDDGYRAKGLNALIDALRPLARILVVAPDDVRSGMSHAITMGLPLFLRQVRQEEGLEVWACSGTPVDCVKLAFDSVMTEMPVLALSGINHGSNSAVSVIYSGTMGAAMECSFYNVPSIGLSLLDHSPDADFTGAVRYSLKIIERVLGEQNPDLPMCLNVNVPNIPADEIRGIRVCRQNKGYWREEFERREDPRGRDYYWLTGAFLNQEEHATDTDEYALREGYVSVVPMQVDMTNYRQLDKIKKLYGRNNK
ncbi:MAG: 5'/3'-nucleotidase SurE [Rikenellaceae bacterium]|jgi:5'-nucleotidase|nr:5'/3'-nucleotidase SurE [Rikenellaceae bacterium]